LVEARRGLGMFVVDGARKLLLKGEREKFIAEEWPQIQETIQRLGLSVDELLSGGGRHPRPKKKGGARAYGGHRSARPSQGVRRGRRSQQCRSARRRRTHRGTHRAERSGKNHGT